MQGKPRVTSQLLALPSPNFPSSWPFPPRVFPAAQAPQCKPCPRATSPEHSRPLVVYSAQTPQCKPCKPCPRATSPSHTRPLVVYSAQTPQCKPCPRAQLALGGLFLGRSASCRGTSRSSLRGWGKLQPPAFPGAAEGRDGVGRRRLQPRLAQGAGGGRLVPVAGSSVKRVSTAFSSFAAQPIPLIELILWLGRDFSQLNTFFVLLNSIFFFSRKLNFCV